MAEGKVGSLFVEFQTNLNQLLSDFQKMVDGVRAVGAAVSAAQNQFSDIGNLGSAAVNQVTKDLGGLTSGISTLNTYVQQASRGISDIGHLGSSAINENTNAWERLTASIKTANTFTAEASKGISDVGHLGSSAINEITNSWERLTASIKTANTFTAAASKGISDIGHLGSSAINESANSWERLTASIKTANTFTAAASKGISDIGHLGSSAINESANSWERLTSGIKTANTFTAAASKGISDIGHLGSSAVNENANAWERLTSGISTANTFTAAASKGISDIGHLGSSAINENANSWERLTSGINTANTYVREASKGVSDLGHLGSTAINKVAESTTTLSGRLQQASNDLRKFERSFAPISQAINDIGVSLSVGLTAPLVAATAYVVKTGITFESAFAGVRKTVQATEEEFTNLRSDLIKLSTAAPVSAAEFAKIAQAAGELGLKAPQIARFSQTVAELTATTRLSSDEAANFLGRFSNITQLDPNKIHNVASTLVALGHGFAASESEIAAFSLRIARVGSFVGLSQADILAFSAALASVGLTAEAGGSAITRVFADIATAVAAGGTKLKQFASVARIPFDEFRNLFKADPSAAVGAYIDGLKRINKEGGDVFSTLKALGESNIRVRDTLLALAKGEDQLINGLTVSRNEIEKDGELTRAYGERNRTTASQLQILRNQVDALSIDLFGTLAPAINNSIIPAMKRLVEEGVKPLVDGFIALPPSMQLAIGGVLTLAAVIGPALLLFNKLYRTIEETKIILRAMTADTALAEISFAGLGTAVTILAAAFVGWELENKIIDVLHLTDEADKLKKTAGELGDAILKLSKITLGRLVDEFIGFAKAANDALTPVKALATLFILLQINRAGNDIKSATDIVNGLAEAMKSGGQKTREWSDSLSKAVENAAKTPEIVNNLSAAMARVAAASGGPGGSGKNALGPSPEELEAQGKAAEALVKEHEKLIEKFTSELLPATELNKELSYLSKYFSEDEILAVYGKKIVDAAEAQWDHNAAVSGSVGVLYEQAKALQTVQEKLKDIKESSKPESINFGIGGLLGERGLTTSFTKNNIPGMVEPGNTEIFNRPILYNKDNSVSTTLSTSFEQDGLEILIPTIFNGIKHTIDQAIEHYQQTGENLGKFVDAATADAYATALHNAQEAAMRVTGGDLEVKAFENFDKINEQIKQLTGTVHNLNFLPADQAIAMLDGDLDTAAKNAEKFKMQLDPAVALLIKQKKAAEDAAAGLKTWQDVANAGNKTFDNMTTQVSATSAALLEMLDDSTKGLATAQIFDLMGAAIDELAKNAKILRIELDPAIQALIKMRAEMKDDAKGASDFGKEVAAVARKISTDLARGIADALINSRSIVDVAKKIGQDFAAAFIEAAVQSLTKKLVEKLAVALEAHPVAAAIAAVVIAAIAVVRSLSDSHLFANQFVKETQNPFAKSLSQFLDTSNKLYEAGRQTYQGAQDAETKVRELWQNFLDDAAKFGEEGRKQATVAQQAIETLSPTFRRVIFDIQAQIESLKPPSVRAVESVNALAAYRAQLIANTDEHIAELQAEATAIDDQIKEVQRQIDAQQELGGSTAELNAQMQELIYVWDAVQDQLNPLLPKLYTFAEAVKSVSENLVPDKTLQFLDQVLNATSGAANLEEALGVLESIGTPIAIIIDRLGGDIEDFANALELSGLPIPPLIEKYLKLKNASEAAVTDIPKIANSFSKLVGQFVDKVRSYVNGDSDLTNGIIDAIGTLLNKIPNPATSTKVVATMDTDVKNAVDDVRIVAEGILAELKGAAPAVPDTRSGFDLSAIHAEPGAFPRGTTGIVPIAQQIYIVIEDHEIINNEFTFTDEISREVVRDNVIPEITEALTNNTDSTTEKWVRILRGAGVGVANI